ncbi:MAG: hypothetical protein HYY21_09205 [Candidatus Tectomicrobia bacterium]|nr:hypothetical protein [Candidatus Tectomicrobia bacterium]
MRSSRSSRSLHRGLLPGLALSFFLLLSAAMLLGPEGALGQGLAGIWQTRSPQGAVVELRLNPDGTVLFNGATGRYLIRRDVLIVQMPGERPEQFRFALQGDRLLLWEASQGLQLVFSRAEGPGPRAAEPPPPPPERRKAETGPGAPIQPPEPRRGARETPGGDLFTSSDRTASFRLPSGWSAQEVDTPQFTGIVVNPGLKPGDVQDARILIARNRLTRAEQQLGLAGLVQKGIQDFLKQAPFLRPDGDPSIHQAAGGGEARAVLTLSGIQPADGRAIHAWLGALVTPPYSFAVFAMVLNERWEHYRPRLEALFASFQGREPERNRSLEQALAGQWNGLYAKTSTSASSSREALLVLAPDMTFRYRYTSSLSVQSGALASSVSEEHDAGTWEVRGRTLHLLGQRNELAYDLEIESRGGAVAHFKAAGMIFSRSGP